jgi:hypothetical protein
MPLQRLTVMPKLQGGHEYHVESSHSQGRASRKWSNIEQIARAGVHLLALNKANNSKQEKT